MDTGFSLIQSIHQRLARLCELEMMTFSMDSNPRHSPPGRLQHTSTPEKNELLTEVRSCALLDCDKYHGTGSEPLFFQSSFFFVSVLWYPAGAFILHLK